MDPRKRREEKNPSQNRELTSSRETKGELVEARERAQYAVAEFATLVLCEEAKALPEWNDGFDVQYSDEQMQKLSDDLGKVEGLVGAVREYVEKIKQMANREDRLEGWLDLLRLICNTPCIPGGMTANDRDGWLQRYGGHWLFTSKNILRKDLMPALEKEIRGGHGQEIQAQLLALFEREPTMGKSATKNIFEASEDKEGLEEMGFFEAFFEWNTGKEEVDISGYDHLVADWIILMNQGPKDLGLYFQERFKHNLWVLSWGGINEESKKEDEEFLQGLDVNKQFLAFNEQHSMNRVREVLFQEVFRDGEVLTRTHEDLLLEWVKEEDEACLYRQKIAEIMRRGDQEYFRKNLVHIHKTHEARSQRELAWSLLRRLDLGDVAVTEKGVKYLGAQYDLGERNQEDYVVRRLTTAGDVAVFDEKRHLDGVFVIQEESASVKAEVRELTVDDVALPDHTKEAVKQREQRRSAYIEGIYRYMTERFFDETAIYPADLSIYEQAALVECLDTLEDREREETMEFLHKYKLNGVRSLISLRYDRSPRERLQDLQEVTRAIQDPEYVFADHAKLVQFVFDAHKQIAPFLQQRLATDFNEKAWVDGCMQAADQYLCTVIEDVKKRGDRACTYEELLDAWKKDPSKQGVLIGYDGIVQKIAVDLANQFEAEEIRALLQELPDDIARLLVPYLQPETPGEAKEDLKMLYESIRFEEYALNQKMTPKELARLRMWLPKGQPVLDAGCGTGRLLVPLANQGFDMYGLDYAPRHVQLVQRELSGIGKDPSRIKEGSWLETGYPDRAFKAVACLGRNILHEYRLERQKQFFHEMNRILEIGGRLIIDIPDASVPSSHYHELAAGYQEAMRKRGIHKTRPGTIFDSPDNKNFATRYTYSEADIHRFAKEAGFEIEQVESEELPTGQNDKNLYFVLRKVKEASAEEALAMPQAA